MSKHNLRIKQITRRLTNVVSIKYGNRRDSETVDNANEESSGDAPALPPGYISKNIRETGGGYHISLDGKF